MAEEVLCLLLDYDWPGNVRELKSVLESAANLAQGRPLRPASLPAHLRRRPAAAAPGPADAAAPDMTLAEVERRHILGVMAGARGNKSQAARRLGIGLNTLRRKLAAYGIA
jgi:DNA-binding NtrC family response regulator